MAALTRKDWKAIAWISLVTGAGIHFIIDIWNFAVSMTLIFLHLDISAEAIHAIRSISALIFGIIIVILSLRRFLLLPIMRYRLTIVKERRSFNLYIFLWLGVAIGGEYVAGLAGLSASSVELLVFILATAVVMFSLMKSGHAMLVTGKENILKIEEI